MIGPSKRSYRSAVYAKVFILIVLHVICAFFVYAIGEVKPLFWGLAIMAYTLGMRHAFDLDHIVFIDNAVRKLVQQQKNASGVGFYFALGHSVAVLLLVVVLTNTLKWLAQEAPAVVALGNTFIPFVSGILLIAIGALNLFVLADLIRSAIKLRRNPNEQPDARADWGRMGWTSKLFGMISKLVNREWHVLFFGFLFGLTFDTASELSLLSLSANSVNSSLTQLEIILFPVLFAAGMMLMDMIDSALMRGAYSWGLSNPGKKLMYNIVVTSIAVSFALAIGVYKLMESLQSRFDWGWDTAELGERMRMDIMGYILVIMFILIWITTYVAMKAREKRRRHVNG